MGSVIYSSPVPPGAKAPGGPVRLSEEIFQAMNEHYKDRLVTFTAEWNDAQPPHSWREVLNRYDYDELTSIRMESPELRAKPPELFVGHAYLSLQQLRILRLEFPDCKRIVVEQNSHPKTWKLFNEKEAVSFREYYRMNYELERVDSVVCLSDVQAESFRRFSSVKTLVVPMGVDTNRFQPTGRDRPKEGEQRAIKILFAGNNIVRKGLMDLLKAFQWFESRNRDKFSAGHQPTLNIIGANSERRPLSSTIKWLGWIPDSEVPTVFNNNDVFCLPSHEEGMAHTNLEALASGMPIITTRASGIENFGFKDGQHGFLVPKGQPEAILDKLQYFFAYPSEIVRMGLNARALAMQRPWSKFHTDFIKAIESN